MSNKGMEAYFGPDGLLAQRIQGFEFRALQLHMAGAVADCLSGEIPLLAEAGTGTGKTWAYLIPAIESGKKVVVSTGTKTLQDQIFDHDIPFLKKFFFPKLHAVCLKGRKNYLCLRRFQDFSYQPSFWNKEEARLFYRLHEWAARTKTGERAEIPWLPDHMQIWSSVSSGSEQCLGQQCEENSRCFLTRIRQEAFRANLIIVNHHLFFADLALRVRGAGEVLPEYKAVIFDEAHQLEDIIGLYFGLQFSSLRALDLARDIQGECQRNLKQMLKKTTPARVKEIQAGCGQVEVLSRQLHHSLSQSSPAQGRFRLAVERLGKGFLETSDQLIDTFRELSSYLSPFIEEQPVLSSCNQRAVELSTAFREILDQQDPSLTYWYEASPQGVFFHGTPVELAPILQKQLFERVSAVAFTSATISTAGSCGFFRNRLGAPKESREMLLPSPFACDEQALLFIPFPFPAPQETAFCSRVAEEALKVLHKTRGRALFLFTSYRNMHEVYKVLKERLQYPILVQGEKPKGILLKEFREKIESVLLATSSFWEGIDVPGESLSCVLIDKLPFEVPDDPLVSARMDALTQQGKSAFYEYQTPRAIIHLKQGIGRLLRASSDKGIIVIFDARLRTKSYGKLFLKSLPPYRIVHKVEDLDGFLAVPEAQTGAR